MIYVFAFSTGLEGALMPTFLTFAKHSPENCPMINEKSKEDELGNRW
jgi:hypothetical protein